MADEPSREIKISLFIGMVVTVLMLWQPTIQMVAITIILWILICLNILMVFIITSHDDIMSEIKEEVEE